MNSVSLKPCGRKLGGVYTCIYTYNYNNTEYAAKWGHNLLSFPLTHGNGNAKGKKEICEAKNQRHETISQ